MSLPWLKLEWPIGGIEEARTMADLLVGQSVVADVSSAPSAWGALAGMENVVLAVRGGRDAINAHGEHHAKDLTEAEIVQAYTCAGARTLGWFIVQTWDSILAPRREGVRSALVGAKESGLVASVAVVSKEAIELPMGFDLVIPEGEPGVTKVQSAIEVTAALEGLGLVVPVA